MTSFDTCTNFLKIKRIGPNAIIPKRHSHGAVGYDLHSAVDQIVPAKENVILPTNIAVEMPKGCYGRIAPRSKLAWHHNIDVGGGVIDQDYRGPIGIILFNHGSKDYKVKQGDRVAQLILEKCCTPEVVEVEELQATTRDTKGFGSTGK